MLIIQKIGDFLYTLIQEVSNGSDDLIKEKLAKYYTYGPYKTEKKEYRVTSIHGKVFSDYHILSYYS